MKLARHQTTRLNGSFTISSVNSVLVIALHNRVHPPFFFLLLTVYKEQGKIKMVGRFCIQHVMFSILQIIADLCWSESYFFLFYFIF